MLSDDSVPALDSFISRAPVRDRVDVLLVPNGNENLVKAIATRLASRRVTVFEQNLELTGYCDQLENDLKYSKHRRLFSEVMQQIFSVEFVPEGIDGSFRWGLLNRFSASEGEFEPVYLVKKDSIDRQLITRFITAFTKISPNKRPKIIYDSEGDLPGGMEILSAARDSVQPYSPAPGGLETLELPHFTAPKDRFFHFFGAGALEACAETDLPLPPSTASTELKKRYAILCHQKIQALKGCDRKFDAQALCHDLVAYLRTQAATQSGKESNWFAEALIFSLLDQAYIDESQFQNVDIAITIAKSLNDDVLTAFSGRYINLTAGVTPFAEDYLSKSSTVLMKSGRFVESCYALANKLTTGIHRVHGTPSASEWHGLVDTVLEWAPYCDRLSSVLNAAGVAAMLANNFSDAETYFGHAATANGSRIHQISAEINLNILRHISGQGVNEVDLLRVVDSIRKANITKKLDYHHVYMYANLCNLSKKREVKDIINRILLSHRYLDYTKEDVESESLLNFLARYFTWISDGTRFRGARGDFVSKYNLLPIAPFIWN